MSGRSSCLSIVTTFVFFIFNAFILPPIIVEVERVRSEKENMGTADTASILKNSLCESNDVYEEYGPNLKLLPCNNQVKELQTILRDKNTSRSDFKFYADRLIRLVIEESLNQLPFSKCAVTTPTGSTYKGLKYLKGNCGVSIIRSGEAMEQGLRDCCRSIRIGKILVESDADTHEAKVVYAKFPDDIAERKVLLMYPIMGTGNTVIKAIAVLKEHNVLEQNIVLSNLFCTPDAAKTLVTAFPKIHPEGTTISDIAENIKIYSYALRVKLGFYITDEDPDLRDS